MTVHVNMLLDSVCIFIQYWDSASAQCFCAVPNFQPIVRRVHMKLFSYRDRSVYLGIDEMNIPCFPSSLLTRYPARLHFWAIFLDSAHCNVLSP